MPWATSGNDGQDHFVSEGEFEAAIISRSGRCVALCGHVVRICPAHRPFGPECHACTEARNPTPVPPVRPARWWRRRLGAR